MSLTLCWSDYLTDCLLFPGLAETLNETQYLLPQMTKQELRQAIVEPVRLFMNGAIEEELVDTLIGTLRSQEDRLPILQHTLLWMWMQEEWKRSEDTTEDGIHLTLDAYIALEMGENALSRNGDKILERMSSEERKVAGNHVPPAGRGRGAQQSAPAPIPLRDGREARRRPSRCAWSSASSMRFAPRTHRSFMLAGSTSPTILRSRSCTRA